MLAELTVDDLTDHGMVLSVGGAEQSHVEVGDPSYLLHDYLRRMTAILMATVDTQPNTTPADALHLGAGALTLPRWMDHRWPNLPQTVVDYEPELVDFVLHHLPMDRPPKNIVADAATVLTEELAGRRFGVVVVDLFNSDQAPPSLTSGAFFTQVLSAVRPGGVLLVNFGDDPPLRFARALTRTMIRALDPTAESLLLTGPDSVMSAEEEGNLVFAALTAHQHDDAAASTPHPVLGTDVSERIWAAGPHPGEVLTGEELLNWAEDDVPLARD